MGKEKGKRLQLLQLSQVWVLGLGNDAKAEKEC
jgi:hypothetical protein